MIRAAGLGKRFKIYPRPWGRLTEWLSGGSAIRHEDFWALRDVSFAVTRGESLGVIGVNGSGKSTLLKILSGAMYPTEGTFDVKGRVLSLLELGTGVNPQLTGRQNVVNSARLLAFPPDYVTSKMGEIEAFADLGEFFDRPVRLYSSGMMVRLVFSMFACFDPDVFVVDEALSVGDVFFQQKCARRLQEMRSRGTTMLFVSHDLAAVEALCDRVMVLHRGVVRHDGDKKTGITLYYSFGGRGAGAGDDGATGPAKLAPSRTSDSLAGTRAPCAAAEPPPPPPDYPPLAEADVRALPWQAPDTRDGFGTGAVEIAGVCFRRADGNAEPVVEQGGWLEVFMHVRAVMDAPRCNLGAAVFDRHNRLLFARGWLNAGLDPLDLRPGGEAVARFALKLDVEPGEYVVSLAVGQALADPASPSGWDQHVGGDRYRELPHAAKLAVLPPPGRARVSFGPANLRSRVDGWVAPGGGPADG